MPRGTEIEAPNDVNSGLSSGQIAIVQERREHTEIPCDLRHLT